MDCYAKGFCKKYGTENCSTFCDLYLKLQVLYDCSNIPKRYRGDIPLVAPQTDLSAFKQLNGWKNTIVDKVKEGENLFIWSHTTGNGKTSWAFKIANYYIRKAVIFSNLENEVVYINTTRFLEQLKEQFDTPTDEFKELRYRVRHAKLLILDDIGSERPMEWACERLYELINERYSEMRTTVFTSNFSPKELGVRLGDRIGSRVTSSTVIELTGQDRRVK